MRLLAMFSSVVTPRHRQRVHEPGFAQGRPQHAAAQQLRLNTEADMTAARALDEGPVVLLYVDERRESES